MIVVCVHHEHEEPEPAVWRATDSGGIELGEFCADHLGDGLDGFDGDVQLERVNQ